jgi:hypothetical protein
MIELIIFSDICLAASKALLSAPIVIRRLLIIFSMLLASVDSDFANA